MIARVESNEGHEELVRAAPFPEPLEDAIGRVARDFGLPPDWLNAVVERQWETGLPPGLEEDITWQGYSALTVGFVGRRVLVHLKLFAAAWVRDQDVGPEFKSFVDEASERLRRAVEED